MKGLRRTLVYVVLAAPLVGLYTTLVLKSLWNWFAADALRLPQISFWTMFGLVLLVGMLADRPTDKGIDYQIKALAAVVDACVPDEKRSDLKRELEEQQETIWIDLASMAAGRIAGASFTFVLGWAVHTFLA